MLKSMRSRLGESSFLRSDSFVGGHVCSGLVKEACLEKRVLAYRQEHMFPLLWICLFVEVVLWPWQECMF